MTDSRSDEQSAASTPTSRHRGSTFRGWLNTTALLAIATMVGGFVWAEVSGYRPVRSELSNSEVVWCDAHRSLVALGAQTLDLLPEELASEPMNLSLDDSDERSEYTATALETMRRLREALDLTPPAAAADIGIRTPAGFEPYAILGPRSVGQASDMTDHWIAGLEGGWDHPHVVATCRATYEAFR